MRAALKPP